MYNLFMTNAAPPVAPKPVPKKIMIVDDDFGVREELERVFSRAGFKVDTSANGKHAQTKLATGYKPDLIITDLIMPVMNGHEFIKFLRSEESFKNIPIMMMTATQDRSLLMETVSFGLTHLFIKPINYPEVAKKVAAHFDRQASE